MARWEDAHISFRYVVAVVKAAIRIRLHRNRHLVQYILDTSTLVIEIMVTNKKSKREKNTFVYKTRVTKS